MKEKNRNFTLICCCLFLQAPKIKTYKEKGKCENISWEDTRSK
jgi:hypothetical protein